MSLQSTFEWIEALAFSVAIRQSTWMSAMVNVVHLVTVTVLAGALLIVDLRLLGTGLTRQPVAQLARDARPWFMWAFLGMIVTGIPQLTSTAMKQYYSPWFWYKMELLVLAVIFTFTVRQWVVIADEARIGPLRSKLVGLVSIVLWSGVAINGRLIGLLQ